jgi:hypothetical protein
MGEDNHQCGGHVNKDETRWDRGNAEDILKEHRFSPILFLKDEISH